MVHECKLVTLSLPNHFILTKDQSPTNEKEIEYVSKIPYSNATDFIALFDFRIKYTQQV